jgi:hypothetical protein
MNYSQAQLFTATRRLRDALVVWRVSRSANNAIVDQALRMTVR